MHSRPRSVQRLVAVLLAVAGLTLTLLAVPAVAAPSAPRGLTVVPVQDSRTPTLRWGRVAGAASYEVEVSTSPSFGTRLSDARTLNLSYVPTESLPSGPLHWRVRSVGSDRSTSGWSTQAFTVPSAPAPRQLSPADDAGLQQPSDPPLLEWAAVQGAQGYRVEVDTDADFIEPDVYTTETTSFVVPDTMEPRDYHWRVRAELDRDLVGLWSTVRRYRLLPLVDVEPAAPNAADTRLGTEDVHLDWNVVPGAVRYELEVSTDPDFNNTSATVEAIDVVGTRYSPPTTYLNNQYYWRVRALNAKDNPGPWQTPSLFARSWPDRPTLVHPADSLTPVGDDFYYEWSPVDHATRYQLDVGTDPNFSPSTYESCFTAATTYAAGHIKTPVDRCMPAPGQVTHWRVRALDSPADSSSPAGIKGIYSAVQRFIYTPGQIAQLSPANGATVTVPTLTWRALRDTESYRVILTNSDGQQVRTVKTHSLQWTPDITLDPLKSPYSWTVQAIDTSGAVSPRGSGRSFRVSDAAPPTSGRPALTPLSGTEDDQPTVRVPSLTWEPLAGADYYRIRVAVADSGFLFPNSYTWMLNARLHYPAVTDIDKELLTPGRYDWYVEAYATSGALLGIGPLATFEIAELDTVAGQQIALTGSRLETVGGGCDTALGDATGAAEAQCENVPATPVLDWDPVPGASHYMVYLAQDRELTNFVYKPPAVPETINTRWTPTWLNTPKALPDSVAGTAYYWIIRPCKATGICAPDPISTDAAATHAFEKHSPGVKLLAPGAGTSQANDMRFDWEDYLLTNQATRYEGDPGYQSAQQYRIQVSTSPQFTTLLENRLVDQSTFTPFAKLYPEGDLHWRVQAVDGNGNGLSWSTPRQFRKSSPEPRLVLPVSGSVTGTTPVLRWSAAPFAASYEVEVYRNAASDTAYSLGNRVLRTVTSQTAFTPTSVLPPSSEPYAWRVRRIDVSGNPGQWNPNPQGGSPDGVVRSRFSIRGTAPKPLAPGSGLRLPTTGTQFSWGAVPGAVTYRVEGRSNNRGTFTATTRALAWATTSAIRDGRWEWTVTALDVDRNVLGTSDPRWFTVDATAPSVRLVKPGATARANVRFVVRFGEPVLGASARSLKVFANGRKKAVPAKVIVRKDRRQVTVRPKRRLRRNTYYTLKMTTAIRDAAGNRVRADSWRVRIR